MTTNGDPALLAIFSEEAEELLEACDAAHADLQNPENRSAAVDALLRALHTLKGAARSVGLSGLGDFTHAFESWLKDSGQIESDLLVRQSRRAIDSLHEMGEHIHSGGAPMASGAGFNALLDEESADPAPKSDNAQPGQSAPQKDSNPTNQKRSNLRVDTELLDRLSLRLGSASGHAEASNRSIGVIAKAMNSSEESFNQLLDTADKLLLELGQFLRIQSQTDSSLDRRTVDSMTRLQMLAQEITRRTDQEANHRQSVRAAVNDVASSVSRHGQATREAGQQLLSTRLIEFNEHQSRLERIVRQTADEMNKQVALSISGGELRLDRSLCEKLLGPIEHLIRNSIAHGIEAPAQRADTGKTAAGSISLSLDQRNGRVSIEVRDDGAGIDADRVRQKAIENGLIGTDTELDEAAIHRLILQPGFSTADALSQVAGRGVGMDVVADTIRMLGGTLDITSEADKGTSMIMRIPQNLATVECVIVSAAKQQWAIPVDSLTAIHRLAPDYLGQSEYLWNDRSYRLLALPTLLGLPANYPEGNMKIPTLICEGQTQLGCMVDQVHSLQTLVIRPLPPLAAGIPGVLALGRGDGNEPVLMLDPLELAEHGPLKQSRPPAKKKANVVARNVLAVDDSPTVLASIKGLLRGPEWHVETASDGQAALTALEQFQPDLVLLDIDMPTMDGIECLRHIRAHPVLKRLTVIMYTGAENQGRKQEALRAGANGFLLKTQRGTALLSALERLLGTIKS